MCKGVESKGREEKFEKKKQKKGVWRRKSRLEYPSKRQTEDSVAEKQAHGAMEKKEAHAIKRQVFF